MKFNNLKLGQSIVIAKDDGFQKDFDNLPKSEQDKVLLELGDSFVQADDDSGYAITEDGERAYDSTGAKAGAKDLQRIMDMKKKCGDDVFKLVKFANNMAKAITDSDKAMRRADAAKQVLKGAEAKRVSEIFTKRAKEL